MRLLLLGAAISALVVPTAYGQTPKAPPAANSAAMADPGHYQVFFDFNSTTLDPQARQVVREAAQDWKRSGTAQISVIGHTDTSGRPEIICACRNGAPMPYRLRWSTRAFPLAAS